MADYTLDCIEHEEYFNNIMEFEETGSFEGPGYPLAKKCKYCGKTGLFWGWHAGGWRLFDGSSLHIFLQ